MEKKSIKKSIFAKLRNNFIAGIVVLIPIGITLYLTLFFIRISGNIIPKEMITEKGNILFFMLFFVKNLQLPPMILVLLITRSIT